MGICVCRPIEQEVAEEIVNNGISSADCEQKKPSRQQIVSESTEVSTATNSTAKSIEVQMKAGHDVLTTLDYDDEVTITYEQFQEEMKPIYSTWAETLFVNLRELTQNKTSLTICDIGCGDGNHSRMVMDRLAELNAKEVNIVGIDVSSSQIELAKSKTCSMKNEYDDISFEVGSAQNIPYKNTFDVAFSMWPFGYAEDIQALQQMMKSCFECLKAGGVCIGATMTMEDPTNLRRFAKQRKDEFNLVLEYEEPLKDGAQLIQHCGPMHFEEVFYHQATYDKVARAAGFKEVRFIDVDDMCYNTTLTPAVLKRAKLFFNISSGSTMFVLSK